MGIRELKAKDIRVLVKMLGKLKPADVAEILLAIEEKESKPIKVGLLLFRVIAADLTDDIYIWLADLIGKTAEELDEMPANTPVEIIKELIKRGDFKDFFGSVLKQAKKRPSPDSTTS